MKPPRLLGLLCLALLTSAAHSADPITHSLESLQNLADEASVNPRYLLMAPNGRAMSNEDFRGRFQLITFGYTSCPDICPTTLVDMASILKSLGGQTSAVQGIFITVDPERDAPAILKTYTEFFDPRILGLSGGPELIKRAANHFKVRYAKVQEQSAAPNRYAIDHSAGMYLLGPDGQYIRKFAYGTRPEVITQHLLEYLQNRP